MLFKMTLRSQNLAKRLVQLKVSKASYIDYSIIAQDLQNKVSYLI